MPLPVAHNGAAVDASEPSQTQVKQQFSIFVRAGPRTRKLKWRTGHDDDDLEAKVLGLFGVPAEWVQLTSPGSTVGEALRIVPHGMDRSRTLDRDASLLTPGALVEVDDPLWRSACLLAALRVDGLPEGLVERQQSLIEGEAEELQGDGSFRARLDLFLNEAMSSPGALALAVGVMVLIVLSTATFCVETLPTVYDPEASWGPLQIIEGFCIAVFSLELLLRFIVSYDRYAFISDTLNIIDFVAILPFYLDVAVAGLEVPGLSVLRVARLARVFRLLKMSRKSLTVLSQTLVKSSKPLYMLVFLITIATIIFASLMYYCERGEYDEVTEMWHRPVGWRCTIPCDMGDDASKLLDVFMACRDGATDVDLLFDYKIGPNKSGCTKVTEVSPFDSIPAGFWFTLVTMTTLGYGDIFPTTVQGKVIGVITMLVGILVIALPITVVGSNFRAIYEKFGVQVQVGTELGGSGHDPYRQRTRDHSCDELANDAGALAQWVAAAQEDALEVARLEQGS